MWNLCSRGIEIAQKRSSVWCMMGSQKSGSGSPAICPSNHHTTTIPMVPYQTIIPPPYQCNGTISNHHTTTIPYQPIIAYYRIPSLIRQTAINYRRRIPSHQICPIPTLAMRPLQKGAGLGVRKCDNSVRKSVHHIYLVWISIFPCFHTSDFRISTKVTPKGSERRSAARWDRSRALASAGCVAVWYFWDC